MSAQPFLNPERRLLLLVGGVVAVLAALRIPICPFAGVFGIPCPGCGLSRATFALLRGDFHGAYATHPAVFVALPAAVVLALHATSSAPRTATRERWAAVCAAVVLFVLVAVWLARFAGAFGGAVSIR